MASEIEAERISKLSSYRKKRGNVKRNLTAMKKWFSALENPASSPIDIEVRMDDFKHIKVTFQEVQSELDDLYENDEERIAFKEDYHADQFNKDYYCLLASMQQILNNATQSVSASQPSSSVKEQPVFQSQQLSLKLPEISLPEFTGNIEDWDTFKQGFRSLVHNDARLGSIQKFHYLKGALKNSKATDLISSLELSSENYIVAWKLLEERFENKTSLVFRHIQCLFEMKKVDTSSAVSTRNLLDSIAKHFRGLKSSEVDIPDVFLIYLVSSKIDRETHQQWEYQQAMRKCDLLPNFENMREFLLARCRGQENHQYFSSIVTKPIMSSHANKYHSNSQQTSPPTKWRQQAQQQKSLVVSNNYGNAQVQCVFCSKEHNTSSCEEFLKLSSKERQQKVFNLRLCYNCLSSRHSVKDCRSNYTCRSCNKKHHSLLHSEKLELSPVANAFKPSTSLVVHHHSKVQKQVFLATAIVDVYDKHFRPHQCRVLLDSASHSNFMSERMRQLLGIPKENSNIEAVGFKLNRTSIKHSITTTINSRSSEFSAQLDFLVIPSVYLNEQSI